MDVVTYVSEWCRDRIAPALSPAARPRLQRLSPGVDPERFHPGCGGAEVREALGIPEQAAVVVCAARLAWPAVSGTEPEKAGTCSINTV